MKNKLLFLLPIILFACNSGHKKPDQVRVVESDTTINYQMSRAFAAVLPGSSLRYDTLANGDSLFYINKDTSYSVSVPVSYTLERIELHPKKTGPIVIPPVDDPTSVTKTFTIPAIATDFVRPGAGAEQWHNGSDGITYPSDANNVKPLDVYYRFEWNRLWNASTNSYNWTYFDNLVRSAMNSGQKFSFGIMSHRNDGEDGMISYDGARSAYPKFLHDAMKTDFIREGYWVPDYNSEVYLKGLETLHTDVRNHLLSTSYTPTSGPNAGKSILMADAIYCIDIRGYGNWGEWHTYGINTWDAFPAGKQPTEATLIRIIDAHKIFDRWQLVAMNATFGPMGGNFHGYPKVSYHALTTRNAFGPIGVRRDQWGSNEGYLLNLMDNNNYTYSGSVAFKNLIINKWKEAPVTGEPLPNKLDMSDLKRQVELFRPTSIGNGNYGVRPTGTVATRVREAFRMMGYRINISSGTIKTGKAGSISITLVNAGLAPTYENWQIVYELKSGTKQVWTGTSTFNPKLFLPGIKTITDDFSIPNGDYSLTIKLVDPRGYRQPMPLAQGGRNSDGSYLLTTTK